MAVTEKPNIIREKAFNFAILIASLSKKLKQQKQFEIGSQLFRSAGSIGANIEEAQAAQSKRDFIAKMSIASKEARETQYWLRILEKSKIAEVDLENELKEISDIVNILTRIVKTCTTSAEGLRH